MKGNPKVLEVLNAGLAHELTVVSQYMVHSEMCDNWGYGKLAKSIEKRAIEEMKHAEKFIGRILFLEGIPIVSKLNDMHIGPDVLKMHSNDQFAEADVIKMYNASIVICGEAKDFATREIFESILSDEDRHLDDIEAILNEIKQMGIQVFLSTQLG